MAEGLDRCDEAIGELNQITWADFRIIERRASPDRINCVARHKLQKATAARCCQPCTEQVQLPIVRASARRWERLFFSYSIIIIIITITIIVKGGREKVGGGNGGGGGEKEKRWGEKRISHHGRVFETGLTTQSCRLIISQLQQLASVKKHIILYSL